MIAGAWHRLFTCILRGGEANDIEYDDSSHSPPRETVFPKTLRLLKHSRIHGRSLELYNQFGCRRQE